MKGDKTMKKIYSIVAILALAAGFAGCSEDAVVEAPQANAEAKNLVEVVAYTGEAVTRTALSAAGNDFDVLWSAGDKIMIGDKEFTLSNGEGTTAAKFTGEVPADGEYTVYYPSTYRGVTWPDQKYAADNGISGAPMVATATVSGGKIAAMTFENVGGILRYTVKGDKTIKSITVKGNGIDMTLDCGDGVALTADGTVFNFALPAGTYTDATLTFLATDGMMATKAASEFTLKKSTVTKATFEANDLAFDELSDNVSEGTVGMFYGREAVIVDLGGTLGKVAIATKNIGASADNPNGETYTYNEATASDFLTDGWYVPSMEELYQLSLLCAWDATVPGLIGKNIAALNLPAAGGYTVQQELKPGEEGFYISTRTPDPDSFYGLLFLNVKDSFLASMEAGNRNIAKGSVRPFHKLAHPEINEDSPVGSRGIFRGQEAVVVDFGEGFGKYAVATKNVGADKPCDFGTKYPSSDLPVGTNGWHVPTKEELDALIANNTQTSWTAFNGVPGRQFSIDGTQLFFPAAGEGEQDMYWAKDNGRMTLTESSFATEVLTSDAAQALNAPVRFVCKFVLTADDPVGTIGRVDGRDAMVIDLGGNFGKYAIALHNEGATSDNDHGTYFKGVDSYKAFSSGSWRLPTKEELEAFRDTYKDYITTNAAGAILTLGDNQLLLPYSGYVNIYDKLIYSDTDFKCWSSTMTSHRSQDRGGSITTYYYYVLTLSSSVKDVGYFNVDSKMPVRLFHKL